MEQNSKNWVWAVVAAVVVAAVAWFWFSYSPATAPESGSSVNADDSTATIDKELNATTVSDPNQEMQATDADVNSL